jgi:hypothetical protein
MAVADTHDQQRANANNSSRVASHYNAADRAATEQTNNSMVWSTIYSPSLRAASRGIILAEAEMDVTCPVFNRPRQMDDRAGRCAEDVKSHREERYL